MASTASTSNPSSSSTLPEEPRAEAGPLPSKRGEIGFQEGVHVQAEGGNSSGSATPLPARHPADVEIPDIPTGNPAASPPPPAIQITPPPTSSGEDDTSARSITKNKGLLRFLKTNQTSYGGLHLTTLIIFACQSLVVVGTIVGWVLAIQHLNKSNSNSAMSGSSAIFVHVVFAIAVLGQLIFLERRLFCLRAERYGYLHPGEILPSSRMRQPMDVSLAFSPWNRPPLPTYAAALSESGVGTGDVEDHLIAAAPPPAYGNTRGSRLLLAGFLRDSLRAQRPASVHSQVSQMSDSERPERPKSYASHDEEWEEILDAERARRLEETLSTLERPRSRLSR